MSIVFKLYAISNGKRRLLCQFTSVSEQWFSATRFPSVRLSVKRMKCDKTKETSAEILIQYKRHIHLVF